MTEGDELLALIRQAVAESHVPRPYQDVVIELVARTAITVMTQPRFLQRLTVVMELQAENAALRQNLAVLTAMVNRFQPAAASVKRPRKKAPAKKKAVAKRAPAVRVKGSTASNRQAFKQGYRGA